MEKPEIPSWAGIWFPKGWTIGVLMAINLVAAHLVRFKVQAKGQRLWWGWGVIALGAALTWLVIASGNNKDGEQTRRDSQVASTVVLDAARTGTDLARRRAMR